MKLGVLGALGALRLLWATAASEEKLPEVGGVAFDDDHLGKFDFGQDGGYPEYGDFGLDYDGGIFGGEEAGGLEADAFSRDWIEHVMNFELRESEFFYEDVTEKGTMLKGGFFASGGKKGGIMFQILNPAMVEVYNSQGKPDVFFSVKAEEVGTYTFHFSGGSKAQQVSFIVGAGKKGALKKEQVKTIEEQIKTVDRELRDIQHEGSYLWSRQKSHLKTVDAIISRIVWFTVVEFLVLVAVAGFQVFYVKNLLSYRRLY